MSAYNAMQRNRRRLLQSTESLLLCALPFGNGRPMTAAELRKALGLAR
ncbi:MAG TPA: hypothetical protein VLC73_09550 [Burkholderiales bacterium]|nr:hypothetical protein [Burkholderiales bacterium]